MKKISVLQLITAFILFFCFCSFAIENDWTCPQCNTINSGNFCTNCGNKKPDEIICPDCGEKYQVDSNIRFCGKCGTKLQGMSVKYEGKGFNSPEEAVRCYLDGLKNFDIERMLSAFAWETQVRHYQWEAFLKRIHVYLSTASLRIPSTNDFLFYANVHARRAEVVNEIYRSIEEYIFQGSRHDISRPVPFRTDEEIENFLREYKAGSRRIEKLSKLSNIRFISPDSVTNNIFSSERNKKMLARRLEEYGADEITNPVAAADVEDEKLIFAPTVLRYGSKWYIVSLSSNVSVLMGINNRNSAFMCSQKVSSIINKR